MVASKSGGVGMRREEIARELGIDMSASAILKVDN